MAQGGNTSVVINLTATGGAQVSNTLKQVSGAADAAGKSFDSLGKIGSAVSYALGNAIYGVASRITQLTSSIVENGIQTAATIESQTVALQGLTGSAIEANTLMAQLMETAKKTPFDTANVIDWAEKLLGAGMTADHVNQSINTLGDTFAHFGLSNDQASHAMLAWTQIMNSGVVHAQDLNQLVQAGIPVYGLFAKAMGENAAQLKAQVDKGTVLAKDVLPALEAYANKNFMGSMSKQAQTLSGMWENLKDTINLGIAQAIKPAEPAIKHALGDAMVYAGQATEWLASTGVPKLMAFGGAVKDHLAGPLRKLVDFIKTDVLPTLQSFGMWVIRNKENIEKLGVAVAVALAAFKGISAIQSVIAAIGLLSNPITLAVVAIGALAGGLAYLYQSNSGFRSWVNDLASHVLPAFQTAIKNVGNFWKTYLAPPLKDAAAYLLPKLRDLWRAVVDSFGSKSQVFLFVKQVFAALGPILKDIVIPAMSFLAGVVLDQLKSSFQVIGILLNTIIIPTIRNLAAGFLAAVGMIVHAADAAFGWVPLLGPKLDQAAGWFDGFKNDVNNSLNGIVDSKTITISVLDSHGDTIQENADSANAREDRSVSTAHFSKGLGLKGKNNETKIWNYLKGQGFSSGAAAGVIGNLIAESGLDPGIFQRGGGPGRGLAQWSKGGRWDQLERWTKAHGMNSTSLDGQLAFMMHELQSGGFGSLSALKHMSANDAAAYFMNHYEMPASRNPSGRQGYARAVLARHGGGTAGTPRGGSKGNGYQHLSGAPPFDTSTIKDDLGPRSSLMKSILAGRAQLNDQMYKLIDDVGKAGNAHANALVRAYSKSLLALATVHDSVVKRLKDAQDQVKKIRDASQQLYNQTKANVVGTGDFTKGDGKDLGSIVFKLQNAVNWAKTFAQQMGKLRTMGLNDEVIQEIIAAGPEAGSAYATSIIAGGKAGINQINTLQSQLDKQGGSLGTTASNSMYKAALQAAEGFAKGLEAQKNRLEKVMEAMAKAMVKALKKALGIKSPSTVFAEIGHHTAEGLIHGMNSRRAAVMDTAADLVAAGMGSRSLRPLGGGAVSTGGNVFHIHGAIDPVSTARQIRKLLAAGDARGVNGAH